MRNKEGQLLHKNNTYCVLLPTKEQNQCFTLPMVSFRYVSQYHHLFTTESKEFSLFVCTVHGHISLVVVVVCTVHGHVSLVVVVVVCTVHGHISLVVVVFVVAVFCLANDM